MLNIKKNFLSFFLFNFIIVDLSYFKVAFCSSNPCKNSGLCLELPTGFSCLCSPDCVGSTCDTCSSNGVTSQAPTTNSANACNPNPCLNNAVCVSTGNSFVCLCSYNCSGLTCATCTSGLTSQTSTATTTSTASSTTNVCSTNTCKNNGVCLPSGNSFVCLCPPNCIGSTCESCSNGLTTQASSSINPCASYPCQNSGICVSNSNNFTCYCRADCTGTTCSSCSSSITTTKPSISDFDNACSLNPCQNLGICVPTLNSFVCYCQTGCSGPTCSSCVPATSAPSTTKPILCIDFNSTICQYYASLGLCNSNTFVNRVSLRVNCALSCNSCNTPLVTSTRSPLCVDTQANCVLWKNMCSYSTVSYICPYTCNKC